MTQNFSSVERFLELVRSTKNLSDKTITAYRSDLNDYLRFSSRLSNREDIALLYVQHLMNERRLKDTSIQRKLVVLKLYCADLCERGELEQNPFLQHRFHFKKERRLPKTVPVKDVSKILEHLSMAADNALTPTASFLAARNLALLDLLISTGIRIGEASAISVNDIIPSERTILIHGKGRKQRLIYLSCPQTWNNLSQWLKVRKTLGINTDMVFVNRYGAPISIHGIEYIYKTVIYLAGLKAHSTPHHLRHTFATNLHSNGADLRSVQEILGHANVSTTEIYTEVTGKQKKSVMRRYNYRNKINQ